MPALWSLKCSRVAAISISLAPATDRKLDWVQSSGVIQLTSVNLSLYWAPFGTAQRLKMITFIPRKIWMGAMVCFLIKYARGYFLGVWKMRIYAFKKHDALGPLRGSCTKTGLDDTWLQSVCACMGAWTWELTIKMICSSSAALILMINPCNSCLNGDRLPASLILIWKNPILRSPLWIARQRLFEKTTETEHRRRGDVERGWEILKCFWKWGRERGCKGDRPGVWISACAWVRDRKSGI